MRSLKANVEELVTALGLQESPAADRVRAAEVNELWKNAVEAVFKAAAPLVLDHTNQVYVMSGEQGGRLRRFDRPQSETRDCIDGKVIAVNCDDSLVRSELDNQQEAIKRKFKEQGEDIEALKIIPSTGEMKRRHPFRATVGEGEGSGTAASKGCRRALTPEERTSAREQVEAVENPRLREALYRAILAAGRQEDSGRNYRKKQL